MNRAAKFFSSEKFGRGAECKISNFGKNFAMSERANFFGTENFSRGAEDKIPNSRMNFVIDEGVIISAQKNLAQVSRAKRKRRFLFC